MKILKKLLYLLTNQERKRLLLLFLMILIMALLDMVGVASIMPFIAVLINPELIQINKILNKIFIIMGYFGVKTNNQFLFSLGIFVFIFLVISLAFKALTFYFQQRFILMREYSIGKRLVENYIHLSYSWFLSRNSANLGKNVLSEVSNVIGNGILPMITLMTQFVVVFVLMGLLVFIDLKLAFIISFVLTIAYFLCYKVSRAYLKRIGKEKFNSNQERFEAISEIFGAIKEVKASGLEQVYIKRFSKSASIFANHQASAYIIGQLPRFAFEAIAFGGIILVILYLMGKSYELSYIFPIVALYTYAGYRLMPAVQQIYSSIVQLRFVGPSLNAIHTDLISLQSNIYNKNHDMLPLTKSISLSHINYSYPNTSKLVLKDISLTIPIHSTVGLTGATGSGKSTIVDLILGLLETKDGTLKVDDQVISEHNLRNWQQMIGYVPQQIYLADDTINSNIALGICPKDIDQKAIQTAAKVACLQDLIENELPRQYQTVIGERGVRLSGGQRQRIGIARALYRNPKVLILDESTNALDSLTEERVLENIRNTNKYITIILITHRLKAVRKCNKIFLLHEGKLTGQGTFEELIQSNDNFRTMSLKN